MLIKIIISFLKVFTQVSSHLLCLASSPQSHLAFADRFCAGGSGILPVLPAVSKRGCLLLSSGRSQAGLSEAGVKMADTPTSKMAHRTGSL